MRLYLINPCYPFVNSSRINKRYGNQFRVWKPLSLLILTGLTPPVWDINVIDENLGIPGKSHRLIPFLY